MADGKIVIDVIMDDGSIKKGMANLDGLAGAGNKAGFSLKNMVGAGLLVKGVSAAFGILKDSVGDAVSRFDTMQKFPKVMSALGFSTNDSNKSIKKLSDGIDGLPTKLDDVVSSTQQMTSITGDLDKSTDTVLALNNAFLASGASTEDAQRGMQQYNQMLSTGQVDLESWKTLQETMPLALQKTAEAMGFTGKSAQRDLYAALKDGTVTFDQFQDKLIELGTGTGQLAGLAKENSLGISTSFGNLRNAVSKNLANILTKFDELIQKLTGKTIAQHIDGLKGLINTAGKEIGKAMDSVGETLERLISFYKDNKTQIDALVKALIAATATFVAFKTALAIGSVISTVTTAVKGLVVALSMIKSGAGALALLKFGFTSLVAAVGGPVVIIGAVIAALVAGIVYLWKTNEGFRNAVIGIWEGIKIAFITSKDAIITAWNTVGEFFTNLWQTIKDTASGVWNGIVETVTTVIESIKTTWTTMIEFFTTLWQTIKDTAAAGWQMVIDGIMAILQPFIELFKKYWNELSESLSTIWEGIKMVAQGAWELIKNIILTPVLLLVDLITGDFGSMGEQLSQIWENIKAAAGLIWDGLKTVVSGVVSAVVAFVQTTFTVLKDALTNIWNMIKDTAVNLWNELKDGIINIVTGLVDGVKGFWNGLKDFASNTWNAIKSTATDMWNGIKDGVVNIAHGLVSGAQNAWEDLKQGVSDAISKVKDFFHSLADVNLFDIGKDIIQGLINGIGSMVSAVWDKITGIANDIKEAISGALDIHSPSRWMRDMIGKNMMRGWEIGLDRNASLPLKSMDNILDNFSTKFTPESLLAIDFNNGSSGAQSIINNSDNRTDNYQPNFNFTIEHADLSSDRSIEETSLQLAKLTERQGRGRLN